MRVPTQGRFGLCNHSVSDQLPSQPHALMAKGRDLHLLPLETLSQDSNSCVGKGTEAAQRGWKAEVCAPLSERPVGSHSEMDS